MKEFADSTAGLIFSVFALVALAAGAFLLLSSGGVLFERTSLDFGHLVPWIAAGAVLLILSRLAALAQGMAERRELSSDTGIPATGGAETRIGTDYSEGEQQGEHDTPDSGALPMSTVASAARGVLTAAGGAVLIGGILTAIATLASTIAARPGGPDLETLDSYLDVFGSLIKWVFVAAVLYAATRVVEAVWPAVAETLQFSWRPAVVLAAAYVLLSDGGLLQRAFEFPGTLILVLLAIAMALPYLSNVGRKFVSMELPRRATISANAVLLVSDIGWMALVIGIMLSLPGLAGGIPEIQEGGTLESVAPYLDLLDTLALWSVILLAPFIVIRIVAAFRPTVGEVVGFPMGRIILFALSLIMFSGNGVPATASSFPIPNLMPAIGAALVVSYLTLVLRRVGQLGLPERIAIPLTNIPPLVGAFMPALSVSLVAWAVLQSLPLISAPLMDFERTEAFGHNSLPYFAGLFDARIALTGFVFAAMLFFSLPDPLWTPARLRVRPMLAAIGFSASGCLLWLSLAPLSGAGHAFTLLGAIGGAGFITLGLCQLTAYLDGSRDPLISGAASWLTSSKARGFLMGASLAFYGMLLRPAMYETLWFAAVYEWILVLAVAVWAMFRIRGNVKTFVETAEATPSNWVGWERHEQQFEDRPDPRRNLVSRWQQRFAESGEWSTLWSYLMGLLCRNNASPDDVRDVFRPLRQAVAFPAKKWFWQWKREDDQRRREAGLAQCLRCAERALSGVRPLPVGPDSTRLAEEARPFVETGEGAEAVAASVISEYRSRGADTNSVVSLWFPLVNVVDQPEGWLQFPWVRRRNRAMARERRRRLVDGAVSHLSGEGSLASLAVGIAARRVPLSPVSLQTGQAPPPVTVQPDPPVSDGSAEPIHRRARRCGRAVAVHSAPAYAGLVAGTGRKPGDSNHGDGHSPGPGF